MKVKTPIAQCKAHLQLNFKGRQLCGCKSALHFPLISFLFFFLPFKTKFLRHAKARQTKDNASRQLSAKYDRYTFHMTEKRFRPVYNLCLLQCRRISFDKKALRLTDAALSAAMCR
jgi:hypothetical protein